MGTNKRISIKQSLVSVRPRHGWRFSMSLNGVPQVIEGKSASDVHLKTKELYRRNKAEWCDDDWWIDANIQWMSDTPQSKHKAYIKEVLALRDGGSQKEVSASPWIEQGLSAIALVLASSTFDSRHFRSTFSFLITLADEVRNPHLGDAGLFTSLSEAFAEIQGDTGPKNREDARKWFYKYYVATTRKLGKKPLGYHDYSIRNHWKS